MVKNKKVLLVSHEMSYTGAPRSLLQMAGILKEGGYCVSVWTLRQGVFAEEFQKLDITVKAIVFPDAASEKLAQELKEFQIVIANTIFTASFARYAQKFTKTILYIREAQNIPRLAESCFLDESDILDVIHVVCVSEYAEEFIRNRYHREKITVLHNFVDDVFIENDRHKKRLKKRKQAGEIHFFVAGTLEPRKGQDVAIKAFRQIAGKNKNKQSYLHFAGAMPEWAADYQRSLNLGSDKRIIYHGEIRDRKELLKLYEKMDVILVPSIDESCSLVTLEAAMMKKAVILTENTGAKYLVDPSCIVPTGNSEQMAEKMYEYICKPKKMKEDGEENRKRYLEGSTGKHYRKAFLEYIRKIEQQSFTPLKEDGIKVSIVVPIYNVESYLPICLESLIVQTLSDIEIICVNDGSTDNSQYILEKYKEKDSRIQIIRTSNMGYGHAMNVGIRNAAGKYIGIVEPDDYVDAEMYEILYHRAIAMDADIVKADFYRFYGEGEEQENIYFSTAGNAENYRRVICPKREKECFRYIMNTWTGIYRRDFLEKNHIYHNESPGASFQDNGFWFQTFCYAERITFVDRALYYNRRDNPNSSVCSRGKIYCANEEFSFIRKFLEDHPCLEKEYLYYFSLKKYHTYLFTLERIGWEYKREYLRNFSKEFCEAEKNKELCQAVFTPQEWSNINWIMRDWEEYYEKAVKAAIQISVVIPVYNAEKYLYQCLESLEKQYYRQIEIICIDDGSTDSSLHIMEKFANKDKRFKIYHQQNFGAGAARNKGMELAAGEYIIFLDADDYFAPEMLLHAYQKIRNEEADICVMDSWQHDMQTGQIIPCSYSARTAALPCRKPFRVEEITRNPFRSFVGWAWDKLYRKSFLLNNGLRFQEQRTSNDMYFTYMSLFKADKITTLEERMIYQRRNIPDSLSMTRDRSWDCFYYALVAIKQELKKMGVFDKYRKCFVNYALHSCLWNLKTLPEEAAGDLLVRLHEEWFEDLGIDQLKTEEFEKQDEYEDYERIRQCGREGLRACRENYAENKAKTVEKEERGSAAFGNDAEYFQYCLNEIRNSKSYKIGRAVTWLPRKIRGW